MAAVPELRCLHEEADTRIILHAIHASETHRRVVIASSDTDVAIITLFHRSKISADHIQIATGTGDRKRLVDVNAIHSQLTPEFVKSLPALHAISGCDTTSAFVGKGKATIYNLVKGDIQLQRALSVIGDEYKLTDLPSEIEILVCRLYSSKKQKVDDARVEKFAGKSTERQLPPTSDALFYHTQRANYQTAIWKRSHLQDMESPQPAGHGWNLIDGKLTVKWMDKPPAPPSILQSIACGCKKTHCTETSNCSCRKAGLQCTDLCQCEVCVNAEDADDLQLCFEEGEDASDEE